ncbi:MAG: hypothetical protein K6F08_02510 [bacterium]|nr:hypothetical protein [bacterium]
MNNDSRSSKKRLARQLGEEKRATNELTSTNCRVKKGNHKVNEELTRISFTMCRPYDMSKMLYKDKKEKFAESKERKEKITRIRHARRKEKQILENNDRNEAVADVELEIKKCEYFIKCRQKDCLILDYQINKAYYDLENLRDSLNNSVDILPENMRKPVKTTIISKIVRLKDYIKYRKEDLKVATKICESAQERLEKLNYELEIAQEK